MPTFVLQGVAKAWIRGGSRTRWVIAIGMVAQFVGLAFAIFTAVVGLRKEWSYVGWLVFGLGLFLFFLVSAREQLHAKDQAVREIAQVAEEARKFPERPELA